MLQAAVKQVITLPSNTDGMTADRDGNIYLTALTLDGLMKYDPRRNVLERFVHDPAMVWPDTLSWGADGSLYVISDHLNVFVDGDMNFDNPPVPNFRVWKFRTSGPRIPRRKGCKPGRRRAPRDFSAGGGAVLCPPPCAL